MDQSKWNSQRNIAVVGGGASGMLCALLLSQAGKAVRIFERGDRLGKKLSATGNGQGNLTNTDVSPRHYFTDDPAKLSRILSSFGNRELLSLFASLGGLFSADEKGRVYPTGRQASALTDLLRFALLRAGTECVFGSKIGSIRREKEGFILSDGTEEWQASSVVLATGGKAGTGFGTDGNGYVLAERFSHTVSPLFPSLVQLKTETEHIRTLKGIRADCIVRAYDRDRLLKTERGDVLFTDYGVSGNAVFALSAYLTDVKDGWLSLEFLPDVPSDEITKALGVRRALWGDGEALGCILNNQIGRAIVRRASGEGRDVASVVKDFRLKVLGTAGFGNAQITKGGIPLAEVDDNLQSRMAQGLYFCGEILNVDGECGGYNLQWAFSSAVRVAQAILANGSGK